MPLLQDTGSQLFYCLLSTLSISIESILYLLNLCFIDFIVLLIFIMIFLCLVYSILTLK